MSPLRALLYIETSDEKQVEIRSEIVQTTRCYNGKLCMRNKVSNRRMEAMLFRVSNMGKLRTPVNTDAPNNLSVPKCAPWQKHCENNLQLYTCRLDRTCCRDQGRQFMKVNRSTAMPAESKREPLEKVAKTSLANRRMQLGTTEFPLLLSYIQSNFTKMIRVGLEAYVPGK